MNDDPSEGRPAEPADDTGGDAWPTPLARAVAFGAIVLAGACGALIGWAVADLQCSGSCGLQTAVGALIGATAAAGGVAVIAVLGLQALAEWRAQEGRRRPSPRR